MTVDLGAGTPAVVSASRTFSSAGNSHQLAPISGGRFVIVFGGATGEVSARVLIPTLTPTVTVSVGSETLIERSFMYKGGAAAALDASNVLAVYRSTATNQAHVAIVNVDGTNNVTLAAPPSDVPGNPVMDGRALLAGPLTAGRLLLTYAVSGLGLALAVRASTAPGAIDFTAITDCGGLGCPHAGLAISSTQVLGWQAASNGRLLASVVEVACP
jgi:hypothetical protein